MQVRAAACTHCSKVPLLARIQGIHSLQACRSKVLGCTAGEVICCSDLCQPVHVIMCQQTRKPMAQKPCRWGCRYRPRDSLHPHWTASNAFWLQLASHRMLAGGRGSSVIIMAALRSYLPLLQLSSATYLWRAVDHHIRDLSTLDACYAAGSAILIIVPYQSERNFTTKDLHGALAHRVYSRHPCKRSSRARV